MISFLNLPRFIFLIHARLSINHLNPDLDSAELMSENTTPFREPRGVMRQWPFNLSASLSGMMYWGLIAYVCSKLVKHVPFAQMRTYVFITLSHAKLFVSSADLLSKRWPPLVNCTMVDGMP